MPEIMPIATWLHVSDLHFGHPAHNDKKNNKNWDQIKVTAAIIKDVSSLPDELDIPAPSFILVTGDIAYSGHEEQYQDAKKWFKELHEKFYLPAERVLFVPGNHDLDRSIANSESETLDALKTCRKGKITDASLGEVNTKARFERYKQFANEFNEHTSAVDMWALRLDLSHEVVLKNLDPLDPSPKSIVLIGINSAVLSQDNHDEGKLGIGPQTTNKIRIALENAPLAIVLTHHPLDWIQPADCNALNNLLTSESHPRIHLCGHTHEASLLKQGRNAKGFYTRVITGACHGDSADGTKNRVRAGHGYNIAMLGRTKDALFLRIWHRIWADKIDQFVAYSEISARNQAYQEVRIPIDHKLSNLLPEYTTRGAHADLSTWMDFAPTQVFPANYGGFSRQLIHQFKESLKKSTFYYYKGDTAKVTSVQLERWLQVYPKVKIFSFLLAQPDVEILQQRCLAESKVNPNLVKRAEAMVRDILVTLVGIHKMGITYGSCSFRIKFFREEPFERVEILEHDIYLTMYGLGGQFGTTLRYPDTSKVHGAMKNHFELAFHAAKGEYSPKDIPSFIEQQGGPTFEELVSEWEKRKEHFKEKVCL